MKSENADTRHVLVGDKSAKDIAIRIATEGRGTTMTNAASR